jgi:hypothetical protein
MAKYLDEKKLKYVTKRDENGIESVICRDSVILYRDGCICIYDGPDVVFRCDASSMEAGELMSLEGVVITASDLTRDGESVTVVAYYKYWREVSS